MSLSSNSISVAVRVRPPTDREKNLLLPSQPASSALYADSCLASTSAASSSAASHRSLRSIIRVLDQRVLIFDPPESNPLQQAQRRILAGIGTGKKVKDMRFCFDRVFDERASQEDVYEGSAKDLVEGVLDGFNATVFAYGATGCGKTHTITGTPEAPGIVYLLMRDLFGRISAEADDMTCEISISYLEIYNETIRDLLNPNAPALNLRESNSSVTVPGLTTDTPESAADVIRLISSGNAHRTVHGTEANAVSSRSHAVLSVNVRRKARTASLSDSWSLATLNVIDLAGSERASVTKNKGDRLLEGANINKSLLALGNCINALCDPKARGGHVPYRNSKLTRLLKHSLGGNCRTLMIVCIAPTSAHYDETHNTLQYANRAKEIKTKASRNIISVDRHVSQYVQVIFQLRQELEERKRADQTREDRIRTECGRQQEELTEAIDKAYHHWEDYIYNARPASCALGTLEGLSKLVAVFAKWTERAAEGVGQEHGPWLRAEAGELSAKLMHARLEAAKRAEEGKMKKAMHEACLVSLGRSVERQTGPEGKATFDKAVAGWENKIGQIVLEGAFREGIGEVVSRMTAEMALWCASLRAKLLGRDMSEQVQSWSDILCVAWVCRLNKLTSNLFLSIHSATEEAFKSLLVTLSTTTSPTAPVSSSSTSNSFTAPTLSFSSSIPTNLDLHNNLRSSLLSKPSPSPSPPVDISTSLRLPKARRPSGLSSPKKTFFSKKALTNKSVSLPKAANGILKSRAVSGATAPMPKAGVRWRDEASEGQAHLESFDELTMSTEPSVSMDGSMLLNQSPLKALRTVASRAPSVFSKPLEPDPSTSVSSKSDPPPAGPSTKSEPVTSTPVGPAARGSHFQLGYLSRRQTRPLASLGEEDENEESTGASASAGVFKDQLNAQPPKKARRESSIGPIRTASRRQSLSFYHRQPRDSLAGVGGLAKKAGRAPTVLAPLSPRRVPITTRRASLLPVPSGISGVFGQRNGPGPAWR